jgi:transposase
MVRSIFDQRQWLVVERLPPYAYGLNPVEQVRANLCPDTISEATEVVDEGLC